MEDFQNIDYEFETLAVRAGRSPTNEGEHSEAIFMTSSYTFSSAAEAAARFSGEEPGNIYSRFTNPTVRAFEERLAALEGGEACVATASGMSAILSTCMGLLQAGDHVLCSRSIFGTTTVLFTNFMVKFGVEVDFVSPTDFTGWEEGIKNNTRMLFLETPSNPLTELVDIKTIAELAHINDCLLVVDNCFCTPALQRPLELGADIVIHSATKFLDGQGRCMGGAVVGSQKLVGEKVMAFLRSAGPSMSAFNAWIFIKGLETLRLRMEAHTRQATELATWLESLPQVERVFYPGLESHPQHDLAKRQQSGAGGLLSFEVQGGKEAGWRVIDNTRILSITANLGDTKTTITHPATTTHGRLSPEVREESGITDGLVRVAVGLEHIDDIKTDLARGIEG